MGEFRVILGNLIKSSNHEGHFLRETFPAGNMTRGMGGCLGRVVTHLFNERLKFFSKIAPPTLFVLVMGRTHAV